MMCERKILEWRISFAQVLGKSEERVCVYFCKEFFCRRKPIHETTCVKVACMVTLQPQTQPSCLSFENTGLCTDMFVSLKSTGSLTGCLKCL